MPLTELTKITGVGIQTTTDIEVNHGFFTGIVTCLLYTSDAADDP